MYEQSFYITKPVSNNAFSYERRRAEKGSAQLYVPGMMKGSVTECRAGQEIVFEEYDGGTLRSCTGLASFIESVNPLNDTPLYVFDNHNHAFSFIARHRGRGELSGGEILVHVDQHRDTRMPDSFLSPDDLCSEDAIAAYANTVLNVGNFVPAVIASGCASRMVFIGSEDDVDGYESRIPDDADIILDIDLDFFAPEMGYFPDEKKINCIRNLLHRASLTTIATSPFFIETDRALEYLHRIMESGFHI